MDSRVRRQLYCGAQGVFTGLPSRPRFPGMIHRFLPLPFLAALAVCGGAGAADPPPAGTLADFTRWVIAADYSRDGQVLVTAGGDSLLYRPGDVVLWKVADGTRIGDCVGHATAVWSARLSPDGTLLATSGYDGSVKVWDVGTRQVKHDLKKHAGWVRAVAFAPDGTRLASAGEDGTVVIWDPLAGTEVRSIAAHSGAATCLAFSPDGTALASGGTDKLVKLWNAADGAERARLEGPADAVWAVAFSPNGSLLAGGGADRTLRLWTVASAQPAGVLEGHKDWITSLAFSADGSRLVSGGMDGGVKLWDVAATAAQESPDTMPSSVWTVAFAPGGASLFVGTHAGPKLVATPAPKLLPPPPAPPAAPPAAAPAGDGPVAMLVPTEFQSMAGAAGAVAGDGTVTVTGPLARDTYTIKGVLPPGGPVTAFRLEALADDALPQRGPGRAGNGNFVLSTFAVLASAADATQAPTLVRFTGATADLEQPNYGVAAALDGDAATGWAIAGGVGGSHTATFAVHPESSLPAGTPVTITLDQQYADGQHTLGKFRLSVVQQPPTAAP